MKISQSFSLEEKEMNNQASDFSAKGLVYPDETRCALYIISSKTSTQDITSVGSDFELSRLVFFYKLEFDRN